MLNAFAIRFSLRRIRQSVCCWQAFLAKFEDKASSPVD